METELSGHLVIETSPRIEQSAAWDLLTWVHWAWTKCIYIQLVFFFCFAKCLALKDECHTHLASSKMSRTTCIIAVFWHGKLLLVTVSDLFVPENPGCERFSAAEVQIRLIVEMLIGFWLELKYLIVPLCELDWHHSPLKVGENLCWLNVQLIKYLCILGEGTSLSVCWFFPVSEWVGLERKIAVTGTSA